MGAAIERLMVKLARVQWDPYVAKRGNKIVPVSGYVRHLTLDQARERSYSPEVLADVKAHPDEFFGTDDSIRLYHKLAPKEPWNEWEWPRRLAAHRLADQKYGKGSKMKQASIDETNDAILGAIARTKTNAMVKPPPKVKEPVLKGEFFPKLKGTNGAPPVERTDLLAYLEANDWKMYHGTSKEGAAEIAKNGLLSLKDQGVPQMSEADFEDFDEPYIWDGVYLGNRLRAGDFTGPNGVLLEIDLRGSGVQNSLVEFIEDGEDVDAIIAGSIPPDRIKIVNP